MIVKKKWIRTNPCKNTNASGNKTCSFRFIRLRRKPSAGSHWCTSPAGAGDTLTNKNQNKADRFSCCVCVVSALQHAGSRVVLFCFVLIRLTRLRSRLAFAFWPNFLRIFRAISLSADHQRRTSSGWSEHWCCPWFESRKGSLKNWRWCSRKVNSEFF